MNNERLNRAIALIDRANAEDPNRESLDGLEFPRELLYSKRMSAWLERLRPDADEAQLLAARAQHIRRWTVPREAYPATREGYLQWRSFLYRFHADQAEALVRDAGYDAEVIARVRKMLLKQSLKRDADVQLIEDVACLVFLEHYFPAFAEQHAEDKLIAIVRKTWNKMSEAAQQRALELSLPAGLGALVAKALDAPCTTGGNGL